MNPTPLYTKLYQDCRYQDCTHRVTMNPVLLYGTGGSWAQTTDDAFTTDKLKGASTNSVQKRGHNGKENKKISVTS